MTQAFDNYEWTDSSPDFTRTAEVNKLNFSLAAQLSARWLRSRNLLSEDAFKGELLHSVDKNFVEAFENCQFAGRFQRIERNHCTYFLDGAHTKESMEICTSWFKKQIEDSSDSINILVFNVTGDRDSAAILSSLHSMNFHYVCFATNISNNSSDNGKNGETERLSRTFEFISISFRKLQRLEQSSTQPLHSSQGNLAEHEQSGEQ